MSTQLSLWMVAEVRSVLARDEATDLTDPLSVARAYCDMQTLLRVLLQGVDAEAELTARLAVVEERAA